MGRTIMDLLRGGRWARGGLLAATLAMGASLVATSLLSYRSVVHASGLVSRSQGEAFVRSTFFLMRPGQAPPDSSALATLLQEQAPVGLRYVGQATEGRFRQDLYHRLAVFPIRLPPLRERRGDVVPLAQTLLARIGRDLGRPGLRLGAEVQKAIAEADWPGNVRELANALERAAILADGAEPRVRDLGTLARPRPSTGGSLSDVERETIARALAEVGGNRRQAAERLGIGLRTLYEKLKRYGLS